jgi:hypothetical protein
LPVSWGANSKRATTIAETTIMGGNQLRHLEARKDHNLFGAEAIDENLSSQRAQRDAPLRPAA